MELGLNEGLDGVFEGQEIKETPAGYEAVKEISAEMYTGIEGLDEAVIITGNPFELAEELDHAQGDNVYGAAGCCGLVSCANFLNMCGIETNEDEIVGFAIDNGLCNYNVFSSPEQQGGTTDLGLETILESYGVGCTVYYPGSETGSIDGVAEAIEEGRAVTMGLNAGYLWDSADCVGDGSANHQVTVTGAIRNLEGEVVGLTICDSGRCLESDGSRIVTREELEQCYANAPNASVIISDKPVR